MRDPYLYEDTNVLINRLQMLSSDHKRGLPVTVGSKNCFVDVK